MNHIIYLGPCNALSTAQEAMGSDWSLIAPELTSQAVGEHLSSAVGILDASMRVRIDRAMLEQAPNLRVVSTATTGADHIDAIYLEERHIPLFTLASEKAFLHGLTAAAEHSWLLLMACARRLRDAVQHVSDGHWRREEFPGIMLRGKTLGLIGCGRIGSWMSRYAQAFGLSVVGYDPHLQDWPGEIDSRDLDTLLRTADFVSVHVPLNPKTQRLIGREQLALMKPGAVLINTSRGSIVDEDALLDALEQGRLGAVGLDVLEGEPATDQHPLVHYARRHGNVIITPHIGGFCPEAVHLAVAHAARRMAGILSEPLEV